MPIPVLLEQSRALPVAPENAFAAVLPMPLTDIFSRRYGPLSPIREVRDQVGEWGSVGQTRTIVLADGATMLEELTVVEPPLSFAYRITGFTGALKPLASSLEGRWSFAPVGTGTRITWAWTLQPASRASEWVMPVFGRFWQGYARQALEEIERILVR
ncbi:conserved hypothetical protein [metagenome]|uniref:Polyketide cyclase / dehydrase and lipid transport n=1 Tax=metagenome TaxID=256318 RepID=A0A2P2C709_9ZZZZ